MHKYWKFLFFVLWNHLYNFFVFVCENNPYDYEVIEDDDNETEDEEENENEKEKKKENENENYVAMNKYEDKYVTKFRQFPNEYHLTEDERQLIETTYVRIKREYDTLRETTISTLKDKLAQIERIEAVQNENNDLFVKQMLQFLNMGEDYFENSDKQQQQQCEYEYDFMDPDDLHGYFLFVKQRYFDELSEYEKTPVKPDEELRNQALDQVLQPRLDTYINNYILERTPLGYIYMRYNNDKKTFEYFSNSSMPYRYLEPVCRKYVMTYWCKPLFVCMEDELQAAEERYDAVQQKQKEDKQRLVESQKFNAKRIVAQLKHYNTPSSSSSSSSSTTPSCRPMKNRNTSHRTLPPQMKANLPMVNVATSGGKQLIKEKANRYTWEGRLTHFSPLKQINKKLFNKNADMTYADFKKQQQR